MYLCPSVSFSSNLSYNNILHSEYSHMYIYIHMYIHNYMYVHTQHIHILYTHNTLQQIQRAIETHNNLFDNPSSKHITEKHTCTKIYTQVNVYTYMYIHQHTYYTSKYYTRISLDVWYMYIYMYKYFSLPYILQSLVIHTNTYYRHNSLQESTQPIVCQYNAIYSANEA